MSLPCLTCVITILDLCHCHPWLMSLPSPECHYHPWEVITIPVWIIWNKNKFQVKRIFLQLLKWSLLCIWSIWYKVEVNTIQILLRSLKCYRRFLKILEMSQFLSSSVIYHVTERSGVFQIIAGIIYFINCHIICAPKEHLRFIWSIKEWGW